MGILTNSERAAQLDGSANDDVDIAGMAVSAPQEHVAPHEAPAATPKPAAAPAPVQRDLSSAHSSTELLELVQGTAADAPLCLTCGTKMRPAGSCFVCEGCGSTSGCS